MYKIKQIPEDFIVKEISNVKIKEKGAFSVYLLKKTNYTTEKAVQTIADKLGIKRKFIGYAGNKDRKAITEQLISIKTNNKVDIKLKDIELRFLGYSDKPISIGDLIGNGFIITIRDLNKKDVSNLNKKIKKNRILIPNYFGEQRFSKDNVNVGRLILKREFREAVELIIKNNKYLEDKIDDYLDKNDYIGALRLVPKKILKLYIHSLQSHIFNSTIDEIINKKLNKTLIKNNKKIPIVGFGTEIGNKKIDKIINDLLKKEEISLRDFIIREIPELSSEGGERGLFMEINEVKILDSSDDELNKNKKKIKINFKLQKGSYATVAVEHLFP